MISSKDISVVIQGALGGQDAIESVASVRAALPDAEVILSTWVGSSVPADLPVQHLVTSVDPGARPMNRREKIQNNTNRQLVSTLAGLKMATRRYSLKMRTDFRLRHAGFAQDFGRFSVRQSRFVRYRQRIVIPHYATRFVESARPYPFHPSDIALFGLTEDVLAHFDAPLLQEADWTWSVDHGICDDMVDRAALAARYAPEQHFFLNSLRAAHHDIPMQHYCDASGQIPFLSRNYIANNFVVVSMQDFGLKTSKAALQSAIQRDVANCYSPALYAAEYRLWCDPQADRTLAEMVASRLARRPRYREKMRKHMALAADHKDRLLQRDTGSFAHGHRMAADALSAFYYFIRAAL
ncbi:MAG: hypothetical protein HZB72_04035 [Burkholderiales bacterium]|nr:hypothetical protein [Burkholderiales bacterium]